MLDDILEFVLDLILDLCFSVSTDRKTPTPLRILAGIVFFAVYAIVAGLLIFCGLGLLQEGEIAGGVIMLVIALLVVVLTIGAVVKKYKNKVKDKE
ncbi:MAG: hypothetical protein IKJ01_05955 [Lachnospiraceae bacterium]|nr:hypothetical protein [Lachnospiraceae bacterium]